MGPSAAASAVSLAALLAALLLRWMLDPVLGDTLPLVTLFGAVTVAVWVGGYRTALPVGALGYGLCAYLFIEPRGRLGLEQAQNLVGLIAFAITCCVITGFGELMRTAQRRSRRAEQGARQQAETLRTTLASIGDAVIATDAAGRVTRMNPVAEALTGWPAAEAEGQPLDAVFRIVNEETRGPVANPAVRVLAEGIVVGLANHTVLIARDGTERPIDDSAAPIRGTSGGVIGCVLVFRDITERKRAEEAERAAERRVVATLEGISDAFVRFDPEWRIIYANAEAGRLTDRPRAALLGANHWDEFPAAVGTIIESEYRRAVAERVSVEFEHYFPPLGRWFAIKGDPTPDGGLAVFFRDVTARKRAEEEAARLATESERQRRLFDTVLSATPDFNYTFDLAGRFTYVNSALLALWGRQLSDALGKDFHELGYPPALADRLQRQIQQVIDTRQPVRDETPYTSAAGERQYEYIFVPVLGAGGAVEQVAGSTRDITDRKHAEREIARLGAEADRQRRLYETILSATPDFVYVFSLEHRVLYANEALLTMWGRGTEGAIGRTFLEIGYEPWHAEMHDREIDTVRATKRAIRGEVPFTGTLGRRIYDYIFVPVFGPDGEVEAVAGTTRDVTERKGAETDLRKLTADLSEAHRRKDEFLATLAHELRNPLAPIRNGLHILRLAGTDDGAVEKARAMMERQLTQLVRLVDDLLDVSRITKGKLELRTERVELRAVIDSAVETARPLIEQARHDFEAVVPDAPIFLDGDATRLAQVVSNLLTNSARYTPAGGRVRLTVELANRAASAPGSEVVVTVTDDGVGIPPAMLGRVFEMFTQVDRRLEKTTGGLGIGLSLVKGLVEMHGGTVVARSEGDGKGSAFVVRLPVAAPGAPAPDHPNGQPADVVTAGRRRVLVVDDNTDAADSLAQLLELLGCEARTAHDGAAGIEAAAAFRPDAVLMDIGMPKLNGYDAARRIRDQPWGRGLVLVALTGWGQEDDRKKSSAAGFDFHLVKPVDATALMKLLASLGTPAG